MRIHIYEVLLALRESLLALSQLSTVLTPVQLYCLNIVNVTVGCKNCFIFTCHWYTKEKHRAQHRSLRNSPCLLFDIEELHFLIDWDILSLFACMAFLHEVTRMSSESWALGCPGSGNILFQRRMNSVFRKKRHPWEEILSYSHSRKRDLPITHFSLFSTWLGVLFFFSSPAKATLSGRGYGLVLLVAAVTLPSQLPYPHHSVYCIVNIKYFMEFLCYFLCLPGASVSGCGD